MKQKAFSLTPVFLFNYKFLHLVHLTSLIRIQSIMVKSRKIVTCFLFALLIISFQSGCATPDRPHSEDGKDPALLMKEGMDDFDKGRNAMAIRKFEKIVTEDPYSELADQAMLKMADAYYESEEHDLAFSIYRMFEERHPNYSGLPYVIFRQGMCLFNEVKGFDKNQSLILDARGEFERLLQRYPGSAFDLKAQEKMRRCDELLARYELQVGHFYYNRKEYRAAIGRYEYVMRNYPDLEPCHEALEYAKKAGAILNLPEEQEASEQSPPRRENLIATKKIQDKKPQRPPKSAPPAPLPTRPAPRNEEKSEVPVPGQGLQAAPLKMAFSVQVGAFLVKENAERWVTDLVQRGYRPFIRELSGCGKTGWYSVRILNCSDSEEAFRAASRFREREGRPAIVTAVDSLNPVNPGR